VALATIPGMSRALSEDLVREVSVLRSREPVGDAARRIVDSGLPALPVTGDDERYEGIFGEREFIAALFPGYLGELRYAGFVPHSLDEEIDKRAASLLEPVGRHANRERIDVGEDYSDAQLAETFLHHRVLIVPVLDVDRRVVGAVTRTDFFAALVARAQASA
jgi:CBS domain-containing protein